MENTGNKISVIVPIYKTEKFLKKCIDSITNQTYSNLEIVLVDDGSPDNCGKICDEFAKKDERVRVIHKQNGGLSSARNAGIEIATGDYVGFVDSDDWLDLGMYECLMNLIDKYDADIAECGYRYVRPWKVENKILDSRNTEEIMVFDNKEALERLYFGPQLFSDISIMVWDKIYKRSLLRDIRFNKGIHEDVDFTPRVLYAAKKIVKIDKAFYNYHIHLGADSTSGMGINYDKLMSGINMRERIFIFFAENKLDKISEYTESVYYSSLINGYVECWIRRKDKKFGDEVKNLKEKIFENKGSVINNRYLNKTKMNLFYISPHLYVLMVRLLRAYKSTNYRIRKKITGKN